MNSAASSVMVLNRSRAFDPVVFHLKVTPASSSAISGELEMATRWV